MGWMRQGAKWGMGLAILLGIGGGLGLQYFRQRIAVLPDWYQRSSATDVVVEAPPIAVGRELNDGPQQVYSDRTAQSVTQGEGKVSQSISLSGEQIDQLILSAIAKESPESVEVVKGLQTQIQDGEVVSGAVINTTELPVASFSPEVQTAVNNTLTQFPFLQRSELYVELRGTPSVRDGKLELAQDTQVTLGGFTVPLADVLKWAGVSGGAALPTGFQLGQLQVSDVAVGDRALVLTGVTVP